MLGPDLDIREPGEVAVSLSPVSSQYFPEILSRRCARAKGQDRSGQYYSWGSRSTSCQSRLQPLQAVQDQLPGWWANQAGDADDALCSDHTEHALSSLMTQAATAGYA